MQIRIGCLDGNTYEGDHVPDAEIQEHLDSVSGRIGTGAWDHVVVSTPKEFGDFLRDGILGRSTEGIDMDEVTLIINGRERSFNPDQIVWCEIDYDRE